jgi:mono/diheme cytochrome c family protein
VLLTGCDRSVVEAPGADSKPAASVAGGGAPPAQSAAQSEPKTVADIFPPGPGREQVLTSCGNCHNVACAAIGQRTPERWDALRESHKENAQGTDLNVIFGYLKANFDSSKPAPAVPPRFLEGGCTPF